MVARPGQQQLERWRCFLELWLCVGIVRHAGCSLPLCVTAHGMLRCVFDVLYLLLGHGHEDEARQARLDPPDDFFRVRMVGARRACRLSPGTAAPICLHRGSALPLSLSLFCLCWTRPVVAWIWPAGDGAAVHLWSVLQQGLRQAPPGQVPDIPAGACRTPGPA